MERTQGDTLNLASVPRDMQSVRTSSGDRRGADLVVHDGAQAHDADVDVVFFADQSGVLQSSPARERVTAETNGRNVENESI